MQVGFLPPSMMPGLQRSQSARESHRVQRSKSRSAPGALQLSVIGEEVGTREADEERTGEL